MRNRWRFCLNLHRQHDGEIKFAPGRPARTWRFPRFTIKRLTPWRVETQQRQRRATALRATLVMQTASCVASRGYGRKRLAGSNRAWTGLVWQGKIWQGALGQQCCPNDGCQRLPAPERGAAWAADGTDEPHRAIRARLSFSNRLLSNDVGAARAPRTGRVRCVRCARRGRAR